jgi:thiol-disulfide isomerase/thioredoxin
MKTPLAFIISLSLVLPLSAAYEKWTNKEGKTVELDLVEVTGEGDAKAGVFQMRNGRKATIKAVDLDEESAKRLAAWKPAAAAGGQEASVFDEILDGNLTKLDGKSLKKYEPTSKPTKYYLFYYTASWCGPCHKFTPSLVKFYNEHKSSSAEFEIILITSDDSEDAMDGYASELKMEWPHLKLSKVDDFKKKFNHPGGGIPNLVLTDLEGTIIKKSYEGENYVGPNVVMEHLGTLLK